MNFSINDDSQLVKDARARAFNDAKDRAQQYADLSGLKLGKVISISEARRGTAARAGADAARSDGRAAGRPIEPGQQTVELRGDRGLGTRLRRVRRV